MFLFSLLIGLITLSSLQFAQSQDAAPVKVSVYYESLCPDSIRFFREQLQPTYNELSDIMAVETFAYGFEDEVARPASDGYLFTCQHGADECYGNKVLACGQKYIADHETYLKFAFCVMGAKYPPSSGQQCCSEVGETFDVVQTCANSTEGELLLHDVGVLQGQLNPTVSWVPWIIINDVFTQENLDAAQEDLKSLVCSTYKGEPPAECSTSK